MGDNLRKLTDVSFNHHRYDLILDVSVKSGGLKTIIMGYYLPAKSYLRPKPKLNTRLRIISITTVSLIVILFGVIFTSLYFGDPKTALADIENKNPAQNIIVMPISNSNPATSEITVSNNGEIKFPVQLAYFKVVKDIHSLELKWSTTLEYKNEYFAVEKSENGTDFNEIGCIDSQKSDAKSSDYSYVDENLNQGVVFYRLRQVSENGSTTYIAIEKVILNNDNADLSLYIEDIQPQPFTKYFNVNYYTDREGGISVELFDKAGKKIYKSYTDASWGYNTCKFIDGEKLTDDEYTIRIANSTGAFVKRIKRKIIG